MILFHFTSRQLLPKVQREGITKCSVPWVLLKNGKTRMMQGVQWLTTSDDFDGQHWMIPQMLSAHKMRKTDYRITIAIPNFAQKNLVTWEQFARHHSLPVKEYFETFPDHRHWRIFIGKIPPSWFIETHQNPTMYDLAGLLESN